MARVDLRCTSCGFHFSVTDAQAAKPEGVRCPSCLAPVGVHGPVDGGGRKPAQVLQAAPDTAGLKVKIGIGVGVGVLVLVLVAVLLLMGKPAPPPEEPAPATKKKPAPASTPVAKQKAKTPTQPEKTIPASKPGAAPTSEPAPTPAPDAPALLPPAPSPQAVLPPLPADLLQAVREELLALKEWHLNLVLPGPEKARVQKLAADGKGSDAEMEFLRSILNGPRFRAVKEEATMIREARSRLETEALEGLPMDKVIKTDGQVINGRIVEETDTVVKVERKIAGGSTVEVPIPKTNIKEILKGKGIGSEFKTKWEEAKKGGVPLLVNLLPWCKENSLNLQSSLAAYAILVDDPGRSEARQHLGMMYDPVARMSKAEEEGGFIPYEGRRWLPSELKAKLLRDGYVLISRRWLKRASQSVTMSSLFRDEKQNDRTVNIMGNLCQDESVTYTVQNFQEKADVKVMRKFYAAAPMMLTQTRREFKDRDKDADEIVIQDVGTPAAGKEMLGQVNITVPLKGPILDGTVMTLAEVKQGGAINVSVNVDGRRIPLYKCDAKESKSHDLPDEIRGKTEVQLIAEFSGVARYGTKKETKRVKGAKKDGNKVIERGLDMTFNQLVPEYTAVLFPSHANTTDVFRLSAIIGEPVPMLDKLFENARGVLEK